MFESDFLFETLGPAGNSPRWALISSATFTGAPTFAGYGHRIAVKGEASKWSLLQVSAEVPDRANQRGQAEFVCAGSGNQTAVVVQMLDADDFYWLRYNHANGQLLLENASASFATVLLTQAIAAGTAAAIRLELIGRRARVWLEVGGPVQDRPPDAATDLPGDPADTGDEQYAYGLAVFGAHYVQRVHFCGLPRAVLAPPALTVANASATYDFAPIRLDVADIGSPDAVEWQVAPVESADLPEVYQAITDGSSHVMFVRKGYAYKARARPLVKNVPGAWTEWSDVAIQSTSAGGTSPPPPPGTDPGIDVTKAHGALDWPTDGTIDAAEGGDVGEPAEPVEFAVIGDYGNNSAEEAAVAQLVRTWNPDFIVTTGDNNYDDGGADTIDANVGKYYHDFIGGYAGAYGAAAVRHRFWPALGNHDWQET